MHRQAAEPLLTIVLAAGKGTRMHSSLPKVLHELRGRTILDHVLRTAAGSSHGRVVVVTGHGAQEVQAEAERGSGGCEIVVQEPQLGTGHALLQCLHILGGFTGTVVVLSGDVPGLKASTVSGLVETRRRTGSPMAILTSTLDDPAGYGRIVRTAGGEIAEICEQRDLEEEQKAIREVNLGVYAFESEFLARELPLLRNDNAQGEYYLTDLAGAAALSGNRSVSHEIEDPSEALGINTLADLSRMEKTMNREHILKLMESGVRILDPDRTWIDDTVGIEPGAVVHPTAFLYGDTRVGRGSVVGPGAVITDSTIGAEVEIRPYCVITGSVIDDRAAVGPFAHLRAGTRISPEARIGNFVETKKAEIGEGSKVSHLTYVGDAQLGRNVNIGAGCVTCNYDGFEKHRTVIEDEVFVGSGTMMVAPITIGRGSLVAAGSTLTDDVPRNALAVARARQSVKEEWAAKRREKLSNRKEKEKV